MKAMQEAIEQARLCKTEIPIGCVVTKNGKVIARANNMREAEQDVTAHAEIIAIRRAQKLLNTSRLNECEIFVTLEPCPMCSWAIIQAGIKSLYFGSYNNQYGAMGSVLNLPKLANSKIKIYGGIKEDICNKILEEFFKEIR